MTAFGKGLVEELGGSADDVRNVRTLWDSPNNRAINAALNDHIRNGRLAKSDFGWFPPAALKQQLEAFASTPDSCLNERRWTAEIPATARPMRSASGFGRLAATMPPSLNKDPQD